MKTIALRFAENFAPERGTILAHQEVINSLGFVWYGKLGAPISKQVAEEIVKNNNSKILLIHSGKVERYWASITEISWDIPSLNEIPECYRDMTDKFKCWFKITSFEKASRDVMANCMVVSSGTPLANASKHSMSPYFIINFNEVGNESI